MNPPTSISNLLSTLTNSTTLRHLQQTHARLLRLDLRHSNLLATKLLRRLADLHVPMHPYPLRIFRHVPHPNAFLWTALLRGYARLSMPGRAFEVYSLMHRSLRGGCPLPFSFSALFKVCAAEKLVFAGMQMHGQVILIGGLDADLHVNNTLMDMYVGCGQLGCARKVFDEMPLRDVVSWTAVVVAYSRAGEIDEAGELFERCPVKDVIAWTAVITGYVNNARPREALVLFERMRSAGLRVDEVVLASVASACAQLGSVAQARRVWDFAVENRCEKNMVVGSALVDMFGKCGLVDEALRVFDGMSDKNVYTYSSMISGLAAHGRALEVIRLFEVMVSKAKVTPNNVTFVGLLTACSHAGMVEEGRLYFARMTEEFGIKPTANNYASMVDLLGRAGLIEDAYLLMKSMPMEAHGGVWGALLGACRIHGGYIGIAEIAAETLFKLEPHNVGNYVLLSNIYASAGLWDKVLKLRRQMRSKEFSKDPACSLIETKDGTTHEFFADDGSHPRTREIKDTLEELMKRVKAAGYVPNLSAVSYNLDDVKKEQLLKGHSEKLALAFGLLTTDISGTIRIVKNLRMCVDCHTMMCIASSFIKRDIVVRDNMRFHHFKDGQCSCGGFW